MVMSRLPGLMFDILTLEVPQRSDVPDGGPLHWCTCSNCREMTTDQERLCCRQAPENCISSMAHMQFYVLDPGVLRLARAAWNDVFAVDDENRNQGWSSDSTDMRHTANLNCGSMAAWVKAIGLLFRAAVFGR